MSSLAIRSSTNTQTVGSLLVQAAQLGFAPKIFISSTIDDLKTYREAVAQALRPSAMCLMIDDWPAGHWDVVETCREKVHESYGYFGIFAHYYGSIPPGQTLSITHLEYHWVKKKWENKHSHPPIVIFMPRENSRVDEELKAKAKELIQKKYPDPNKHLELMARFRAEVLDWHIVKFFVDESDLKVKAVHAFYNWGNLLVQVAQGNADVQETNTQRSQIEEKIGLLGRRKQLEAFEDIHLTATKPNHIIPAIPILIYGNEHSAYDDFIKQIAKLKQLRQDKKEVFAGKPPVAQYDTKTLVNWIAENLGILEQPIETPEDLAILIWEELKGQQLSIIIEDLQGFVGGLKAFHELIWLPLHNKLQTLCNLKKVKYPFFMIIVIRQNIYSWEAVGQNYFGADDENRPDSFDYEKFLIFPRLGHIVEKHIIDWLKQEITLPNKSDHYLREIAEKVLRDENGDKDDRPAFVYKRIRFLPL